MTPMFDRAAQQRTFYNGMFKDMRMNFYTTPAKDQYVVAFHVMFHDGTEVQLKREFTHAELQQGNIVELVEQVLRDFHAKLTNLVMGHMTDLFNDALQVVRDMGERK